MSTIIPTHAPGGALKNVLCKNARIITGKVCTCLDDMDQDSLISYKMKLNHNVKMTYLVCLVYGVSSSVWNGTVLVSFLYTISGGSNAMVGYTEAAQGLSRVCLLISIVHTIH